MKQPVLKKSVCSPQQMTMIATALTLAIVPERALAQRALGVDVSSYQGAAINWSSVKGSGRSFAWAKATEGNYYIDPDFTVNESHAKSAGVIIGAYHFARPDLTSPSTEAGYFWNEAHGYIAADGLTLMPMLDMETWNGVVGASSYSAWANAWCNAVVSDAFGQGAAVKPTIYVSACSACNFNTSVSQWFSDIANYNGENPQTGTPWSACGSCDAWGSGNWDAWQYSSSGSVSGISGGVDVDVFNGTLSSLVATMVVPSPASNTKPVALTLSNGAVSSFFISAVDGSVQTIWQNTKDGTWSGPNTIASGHGFGSISGLVLTNGCMVMFGCGGGAVYTTWQSTPGGPWTNWVSLGGSGFTKVKAILFNDGRMGVVGCGGGLVYYQEQTSVGSGWTGWSSILSATGNTTVDAVVIPSTDCASVFACASGGVVQTAWTTVPHGSWVGWTSLTGTGFKKIKTLLFSDGHMAVVGCGTSAVYYQEQLSPGGSWPLSWTWVSSSSGDTEVDGLVTTNQTANLFACGGGAVYTSWQSTPRGSFSAWNSLGGTGFKSVAPALLPDDRMTILGCASGTPLNFSKQNSVGGGWTTWVALGGTVE